MQWASPTMPGRHTGHLTSTERVRKAQARRAYGCTPRLGTGIIVSVAFTDETSEVKAGTVELRSASNQLVIGSFTLNDLMYIGNGATQQLLKLLELLVRML